MSGGAWSRGPPAWVTPTSQSQTPSFQVVMNEQQNEEHSDVGRRHHSGDVGKPSGDVGKPSGDVGKSRFSESSQGRRETEPWYPGKVNRNRKRGQEELKGRGEPVQRKRMEPASASAFSRSSLTTSGPKTGVTVVDVHKKELNKLGYKDLVEWVKVPDHLYIGRDMTVYVPGAVHSKWHNPFKSKKLGRETCCKQYKDYILTDKKVQSNGKTLFESLEELKGKTLGCWCHPQLCHGHILRELVQEFCP